MLHLDWKFKELIAALGGPTAVSNLFEEYGFEPPPVETVKGWKLRNSIPGKYLPALLIIAQERGILTRLKGLYKGAA